MWTITTRIIWSPARIHFLRKYTSYLTPRVGLVSGDTWAAAATYLRNLLLNQAILIGCTILALLVPRLLAWAYTWPKSDLSSVVLWAVFMPRAGCWRPSSPASAWASSIAR